MDAQVLRSWWATRQGLPMGMPGARPADVLAKSGWSRSVGGANPYLTLLARAGTSREEADRAVADLQIHELPSARGCTYVVPQEDFALALKVSQGFGDAGDIQVAKKYLGVTDDELEHLEERTLDVLSKGPKDPTALRNELGDAVRNLGPEGKKRGQTTTLPLILGRLQTRGEIRRVPVNGRIDQQRYAYTRWENNPLAGFDLSTEEAYTEMARRYFRWTGPASVQHFQWFSALGVKGSKSALEPLGLVPIEPGSDLLMFPDELDALHAHRVPSEPQYSLISALDGIFLHRRDVASFLEEADKDRKLPGEKGLIRARDLQDLNNHAIVDRGRIVGLWEYEQPTESIVWLGFVEPSEALRAEVARVEAYVRDQLGDCRSFSLDSPASRQKTIDMLRAGGAGR
ncbi:DNA glycosylase AlkZ-like family protein [Fimbriimonas ginsengisoli]|uniref:Winged helix DNA-binding domain-containing protein n=1 Tax=Fimbriimonas ginsengisoli Gsoil 348 TaxID=661478 RepID=A0A068NWR2_FIMGI|nr:crosslink repair DNA glycosylase YcaQ family protein [Fimbriimonas ginsengisoli]AIE87807.1 hypothetical protein OP10G_4439 [Fimbriimonas ginsengisoli Gsoil 348]